MKNICKEIKKSLHAVASDERRKTNEWFFKTGEGGYSEHDKFIGVRTPELRKVAKQYEEISLANLEEVFASEIHEERLCALFILVGQMKEAVKRDDTKKQKQIYSFYVHNKKHVNNWDLVDASAHYIVGQYLCLNPDESDVLYTLVKSRVMWYRRIAMVSQWYMIREDVFDHVLPLAEMLLDDEEDLMHKAVGWMLREMWKKKPEEVKKFLRKHYDRVPRTALRYTIERMESDERQKYLKKEF